MGHEDRVRQVAIGLVAGALLAGGCGGNGATGGGGGGGQSDPATISPATGPAGLHELTLEAGGEQREYLLEVPDGYDPAEPTPLIVVLHAGRSTPERIRDASGMPALAQAHGVLVAYPAGIGRMWRPTVAGEYGIGVRLGGDPADLDFLRRLVQVLVDEWHADPARVYATGHSNGAAMTYRLAAEAADVFAAVAPVGGYLFDPPDSIEPTRPVPVLGFVGMTSKYTGEILAGLETWRDRLGCRPAPPATMDQGGQVTRIEATCRDGSEVTEYRIDRMGHAWPQADRHGIDATEVMWEFFTAHARTG